MQIRSLGSRTDLIFPAFDGEIIDRGEYLVVRTPSAPDFYWGNFLLFSQPPGVGDVTRWPALFAREIGVPPAVVHQTFGWDAPDGALGLVQPFQTAGFRLSQDVVLTSTAPHPPRRPAVPVQVRLLTDDSDWAQAVENQVVCREAEFGEAKYRTFSQDQMARYRRMAAAGRGAWYGAFLEGRLVADLGLFHDGDLGRYQSVQTHPDFRRRGIAGALVAAAGLQAQSVFGLQTLVIVAEAGSIAERLYAAVGFQAREAQCGLERWPGSDHGS